jgi:hypothetical protein
MHTGQLTNVTLSRSHTKKTKNPKKMSKILFLLSNEYFCNCDTVTLCDTALCDVFNEHLKDDRRHGMDIYLFLRVLNFTTLRQAYASCLSFRTLGFAEETLYQLKESFKQLFNTCFWVRGMPQTK